MQKSENERRPAYADLQIESAHPILNDEGFTLQVIYIVLAKYTLLYKLCQVLFFDKDTGVPFLRCFWCRIGKFLPNDDGVKLCYKYVSFTYVCFLLKNVGKNAEMVRKGW